MQNINDNRHVRETSSQHVPLCNNVVYRSSPSAGSMCSFVRCQQRDLQSV